MLLSSQYALPAIVLQQDLVMCEPSDVSPARNKPSSDAKLSWLAGIWQDLPWQTDPSLGDAWVLNPADFANGNPSTVPGTVIIRPVVTEQTGLHVEMSVTCLGCLQLTGVSRQPSIDKSNPLRPLPSVQSIYNFNPATGSAVSSIPLYTGPAVSLTCTKCYLALRQAALYLTVSYNKQDGFENIQVEADVQLSANLDLALSSNGVENSTYEKPLVTAFPLFVVKFPITGITFTATIDASLSAVLNVQGSGKALLTAGRLHKPYSVRHMGSDKPALGLSTTCCSRVLAVHVTHHGPPRHTARDLQCAYIRKVSPHSLTSVC